MAYFIHDQAVFSSQWTVTHGLGSDNIGVNVFITQGDDLRKMMPSNVTQTPGNETNELIIDFTFARTGKVTVISN